MRTNRNLKISLCLIAAWFALSFFPAAALEGQAIILYMAENGKILSPAPETGGTSHNVGYSSGFLAWTGSGVLSGDINGSSYTFHVYANSAGSTAFRADLKINDALVATTSFTVESNLFLPYGGTVTGIDPSLSGTSTVTLEIYHIGGAMGSILWGDFGLDDSYVVLPGQVNPTISGTVLEDGTPLAGVTMNGLPGNPVTDGSGQYSAIVDYGWSGTVSPTLNGRLFSPANREYSSVTSDHTGQDYSSIPGFAMYLENSSGLSHVPASGSSGMTGIYSGILSWTGWVYGDVDGTSYLFHLYAATQGTETTIQADLKINGTLVASSMFTTNSGTAELYELAVSGLNPESSGLTEVRLEISRVSGDMGEIHWGDFGPDDSYVLLPGELERRTISGHVLQGTAPLAGVVMNGLPGGPMTDATGYYSDSVYYGWYGTVIPAMTGFSFSPGQREYFDVTVDQTEQDYAASLLIYSITGTITLDGVPLPGVVMNGLPGNPVTDATGFYASAVGYGWSGTVTPALSGHSFSPASRTYESVTTPQTGQNFAASINTFLISGRVLLTSGEPLSGVLLSGLPGDPVTDGSGNYSARVPFDSTIEIRPIKAGYMFNPGARSYYNVSQDHSDQNFDAWWVGYKVTFLAGEHGSLQGETVQYVEWEGQTSPVTAVGDTGYILANWTVGEDTFTDNPLTVYYVRDDMTVTANFTLATYRVRILPKEGGTISGDPVQYVTHGHDCAPVTAVAEDGFYFREWSGDYSGSENPLTLRNVTGEMLVYANFGLAPIPPSERQALIDLYNATNGDSWNNNSGWKEPPLHTDGFAMPGTEGGWFGVDIYPFVREITFFSNNLNGTLPASLGNLTHLQGLMIKKNSVHGPIPPEIGQLPELWIINISGNQFSEAFPAAFTNLVNLNPDWTDFSYNALHASDPEILAFLNIKDPDWAASQTIAPDNILSIPVNSTTINLTWDPIPFTTGAGGYRIFVGTASGGPYTFFQQTSDKTVTSLPVTGLNPGTAYYFVIQTRTDASYFNPNTLDSEYSAEATATTIPAYTVTFIAGSGGTLSGTTTQVVEHGSSCTPVTAEPNAGCSFVNWTGDYTGSDNPLTILNVTSDMTITANFFISQYTVTFIEGADGTISGDKVQTVNYGSSTSEVNAVPNTGYSFVNWTGDYNGTTNPLTIANVTTDMTVTANFTLGSLFVSGTILYNSSPLAGVVISGLPGNPATDDSGLYTSAVDYDWSGTVTPTLAGYSFTPANRMYISITSDQTSQNYIAAQASSLELTSPNGWEHWTLGTTKAITWNAINYTGTVRLVLFKNGVRFGNIVANLPASAGSYAWTVGQTYDSGMAPEGSDYRLYLRSTDGTIVDPSDYRLGLIEPAQLEMTSPNGGESWELGTTQNIAWNANGYSGTVRLILFQKAAKIGQIVGSVPADQGSYAWTVGVHQAGVAPAGILYSIRVLAGDGSQDDYSDGPLTLIENEALIIDHNHTVLNSIPSEWLEQAKQHRLLVLGAAGNDAMTLGLRLLGQRDSRLSPATSANELGLVLTEGSWLPQGAALDPQEWRWSLERTILESQATVAVVRPDEQALLTGRLDASGYLNAIAELSSRLPGIKLVCATAGMDETNDILAKFNRQVRESVLLNRGILLDIADIESWSGGEQQLVKDLPVRHPANRMSQGTQSQGNLADQGSAAWWLLARLAGWEGSDYPDND